MMKSSGGYTTIDSQNSSVSGSVPVRYTRNPTLSDTLRSPLSLSLFRSNSLSLLPQAVSGPDHVSVKFTGTLSLSPLSSQISDLLPKSQNLSSSESNLQTFPPSEAQGKISAVFRPPSDADGEISNPNLRFFSIFGGFLLVLVLDLVILIVICGSRDVLEAGGEWEQRRRRRRGGAGDGMDEVVYGGGV